MNVNLRICGRELKLNLERDGQEWVANGRRLSVVEAEPGIYSVLLDGRSIQLRVEQGTGQTVVNTGPFRYIIDIEDPRRLARGGAGLRPAGRQKVTAPMPGRVVRLLVSAGEDVAAGQGLLVIEAMKMQNELKAPKAGRVVSLAARVGATVAPGDVLAEID